jgi:hypothetical protein
MRPISFLILVLLFISCNFQSQTASSDNFIKGELKRNIFSNEYFGFQLSIDTVWYILNKKDLEELFHERNQILQRDANTGFPESKGTYILLSMTTDTVENIPHVLISSLDLATYPHIRNERDYLEDYFRQVNETYKNYNVQISNSQITQEKIGNKTFFSSLITIKGENFLAYQKRYSIRIKEKLLNLMTNYGTDSDLKKCTTLLEKTKWK